MSRTKRSTSPVVKSRHPALVEELASELKANRDCGQPMIDEESFPSTGLLKVTVVWDEWQSVPDDERSKVILESYRKAEGDDYARRITLASGLTVPEAYASGLLPFQIVPFVREGDPVTLDECKGAMLDEGASLLLDPPSSGARVIELSGPEDYSVGDVAAAISRAGNKPVTAVEVPVSALVEGFVKMGASHNLASLYGEMVAGMPTGHVAFEGGSAKRARGTTPLDAVIGPIAKG